MKRALAAAALAAVLLDAGCHGPDTAPVPGSVSVRLATAGVAVKALLLRVVGRETAVTPAPGTGYRVFTAQAGDTVRIAVFARPASAIGSGELVLLSVPDTRRAHSYPSAVLEVADLGYAVVESSRYTLTISTP
jgi:hypothetical protein